jgi:hypothetical protein
MSAEIIHLGARRPKSNQPAAQHRPTEEQIRSTLFKCWREDRIWYRTALAHRLRLLRAALQISEQEAADAFGVTLRTYRKYERALSSTRTKHLLEFADTFDVSVGWLIAGETPVLYR